MSSSSAIRVFNLRSELASAPSACPAAGSVDFAARVNPNTIAPRPHLSETKISLSVFSNNSAR